MQEDTGTPSKQHATIPFCILAFGVTLPSERVLALEHSHPIDGKPQEHVDARHIYRSAVVAVRSTSTSTHAKCHAAEAHSCAPPLPYAEHTNHIIKQHMQAPHNIKHARAAYTHFERNCVAGCVVSRVYARADSVLWLQHVVAAIVIVDDYDDDFDNGNGTLCLGKPVINEMYAWKYRHAVMCIYVVRSLAH